jgi:hypothetical protein
MVRKRCSAERSDTVEEVVDGTGDGILRAAGEQVIEHFPRIRDNVSVITMTDAADDVANGQKCQARTTILLAAFITLVVAGLHLRRRLRYAGAPGLLGFFITLGLAE